MNRGSGRLRRFHTALVLALLVSAALAPQAIGVAAEDPIEHAKPFDRDDPPLFDQVASGDEALALAGNLLPEAAARNAMETDQLEAILVADDTATLDTDGLLFYVDPAPEAAEAPQLAAPFPYGETFLLNSKPGSPRTLFLDFDGHTVSNTGWQPAFGLPEPFFALPFDTDSDPGVFSNSEMDVIQGVWQRVAEDYAPFDVNVTTQDPGFAAIDRSSPGDNSYGTRLVITDTPAAEVCGGCGGVAYVGVFDDTGPNHAFRQPAWCFANSLSNHPKYIAECASHEVGHTTGLSHDGVSGGEAYYTGHSPWAPVMGVGYYQPLTQFSKGEYSNASSPQDDFSIMGQNGVGLRADDHSNAQSSAATVLASIADGVITSQSDVDTFRFNIPFSSTVEFTAVPATVSPNLDIRLELYSSTGGLLATATPPPVKVSSDVASGLAASLSYDVVGGQVYYLQVSGDSHLDGVTGYTRYGSVGRFQVEVETLGQAVNTPPMLTVTGPRGGETYPSATPITFAAGATDAESGNLSSSIVWRSSRDGDLGTGGSLVKTNLSLGIHVITATVTDGEIEVYSSGITITVTPATVTSDGTTDNPFIDDDHHIFESSIEWLAARGITRGCNPPVNDRFCPEDPVTRGQMATFLTRAFGLAGYAGPDRFADDNGHIFEDAIERLAQAGITVGCNPPVNDRFCPDRNVTRGQMAVFLVRAFDLPAYTGPDRFTDDGGMFEGAIERLAQAGVTVGCNPPANSRFCPDVGVTRGQMATFLKRASGG